MHYQNLKNLKPRTRWNIRTLTALMAFGTHIFFSLSIPYSGFRVNLQFCAIFSGLTGGTFGSLQQTWVRIGESRELDFHPWIHIHFCVILLIGSSSLISVKALELYEKCKNCALQKEPIVHRKRKCSIFQNLCVFKESQPRDFDSSFFHKSVSLWPLGILFRPFFWKFAEIIG
jgi:hypothetical protein